jgi:hypothetical protein
VRPGIVVNNDARSFALYSRKPGSHMNRLDRFAEVISAYRRHGWQLRRTLMTAQTLAETRESDRALFENLPLEEATIDALWFARPSQKNREAWELRLVAETPYALFEAFELDETEEQREEVRREMEARMREYTGAGLTGET